MIRKNSRKRILPLVLAAMLVISDAGYGNLPIIYAQESERQTQAKETAKETDTTEQTTPAAEESTTPSATEQASEESTTPSAAEHASEETTQESEPESETGETAEEGASTPESGETTTAQDTDESGTETEETLTDGETETAELVETEKEAETGEEIELLGEERSEVIGSGTCQEAGVETPVNWVLTSDGVLTISGSGKMFGGYDAYTGVRPGWDTTAATNNVKIKKVVIEEGVTEIGQNTFSNNNSRNSELAEVTLPASLEKIGGYAFDGCQQLSMLNFSSGIEEIGNYAFHNTGLDSIAITNPITIGDGAFSKSKIQNVEITYQDSTSVGQATFESCEELTSVVLHGSIASLDANAFKGCILLNTLSIDNGNESIDIGIGAFSGCSRLNNLTIGQDVKTIGQEAFKDCKKLKNVDSIVANAESIGDNSFENCTALTALTFDGRNSEAQKLVIGGYAFSGCTGLEQITLPDGTTVAGRAFDGSENLTKAAIGDNAVLEESIFLGCNQLENVTIGKNATIGQDVSTSYIGAFSNCISMKRVTIGSGSEIGAYAFSGCSALADITLEEGVKKIGANAFMNCTSLKSIELPASITTIENGVFFKCENLTEVIFHGKDLLIAKDSQQRAFGNCSESLTAWVHPGSEAQDYVKDAKILYKFIVDKVSFVPDSETLEDLEENATAEVTIQLFPSGEDSTAGSDIITAARQIEWKSSDETIATITGPERGEDKVTATITAVKAGTCTITSICDGVEASCSLTVVKRVLPVTADPQSGVINADQKVTLSCATEGAVIYYTTDGTEPTTDSTKYETPISLTEDITIKAFAVSVGYADSTVTEIAYKISKITSVSFAYSEENPLELELGKTAELSLILNPSDAEPRTQVTWESDNTEIVSIAENSQEGSSVSAVLQANKAGACIVKAVCDGKEASCKVIVKERVQPVEAQADHEPDADTGKVVSGTKVSLSCSTPGAKIYYTVNNEAELTEETGIPYSMPIILNEAGTKVIRAIAVKDGWLQSETTEFTYDVAAKVEGITLDETEISLGREEVRILTVSFQPEDAVPELVTWRSSDSTVASVEQSTATSAKVTAKKAGTCTITATCGTFSATCEVTVTSEKRVSKVYSIPEAGTVAPGTEVELKCDTQGAAIYYTVDGSEPTENSTRYTTAIKIDKDMTLRAIAVLEGYQNSEEAELVFTVKEISEDIPVTGISLSPATLTLGREETAFLKVSFQPANATPQSIEWSSSDPEIAEVKRKDDISAVVTGNKEGKCMITASCGTFSASCEVTVTSEKRVSKVYSIPEAGAVAPGTEVELKCDTQGAAIYYTVDGSAPTKNSTQYTTAIKIDKDMTIRAIAVLEDYQDSEEAELAFTVKEISEDIPVTGISLSPVTLTLGREETAFLTVSFRPENATPQSIEWRSSDSEIAEVKAKDAISATVTGNKEGKCTITASCGTFSASCEVTVTGERRVSQVYSVPASGSVIVPGTEIALKCDTTGAKIYYTLDGSVPTTRSTPYARTLTLNEDTIVKAIAVKEGYKDSPAAELIFTVNAVIPDIPEISVPKIGIWTTEIKDQPYTGSAIKPTLYVYDGNKLLTEKIDYTLTYKNNKNLGEGQVVIKGKGNYADQKIVPFKIVSRAISDKDIIIEDMAFAADGKLHKVPPTITHNGRKLKAGKDFEVDYGAGNYMTEGSYDMVITGKGNYTGTAAGKITIIGKDKLLSKAKVSKIPVQEYNNGNEVILSDQLLSVTLNRVPLKKDKDYTVSYANNVNQGTATVIIKGIGDYAGTKRATFKIKRTPVDITKVECSNYNSFKTMEFVKGGCTPYPVLKYNGNTLRAGTDYTVSYKKNKKTGSASVVVSGKGAFKGKYTIPFTIEQKDISSVAIRTLNVPYTGKKNKYQSKPILTDTDKTLLKAGTDYTLTYSCEGKPLDKQSNPAEHAEITVMITGKGNYKGSAVDTYKLEGISFSTAKFTVASKDYTGKPVVLSPDKDIKSASIKIAGSNVNLIYGEDYEIVSYSKNIKKGTATVVFSGIGRFSGEKSVKFKIVNRNMNAEK